MSSQRYSFLGATIESDVRLAAVPAADGAATELRVLCSDTAPPLPNPGWVLVASREGDLSHRAWRTDEGHVLAVGDAATLVVSPSLSTMTVFPGSAQDELLSLWVSGLGLAFWLSLRGDLVLHGSAAVGSSDRAVVIVGPRGSGKSTLAGLLCARGQRLLADDSVRLERSTSGWVAHGGVTEVRLRPASSNLSALVANAAVRASADGRLALKPVPHAPAACAVSHIVCPRIHPEATPGARQLPRAAALVELLRGLRFGTWLPGQVQVHQTRVAAQLAREVPAHVVDLPRSAELDWARADQAHLWVANLGVGDDEATRELLGAP